MLEQVLSKHPPRDDHALVDDDDDVSEDDNVDHALVDDDDVTDHKGDTDDRDAELWVFVVDTFQTWWISMRWWC